LSLRDGNAQLIISDDGVGADPGVVARRVGEGHIGLESHRIKIEAAGGEFDIQTPSTGGTVVRVVVPAPQPGILTAG